MARLDVVGGGANRRQWNRGNLKGVFINSRAGRVEKKSWVFTIHGTINMKRTEMAKLDIT